MLATSIVLVTGSPAIAELISYTGAGYLSNLSAECGAIAVGEKVHVKVRHFVPVPEENNAWFSLSTPFFLQSFFRQGDILDAQLRSVFAAGTNASTFPFTSPAQMSVTNRSGLGSPSMTMSGQIKHFGNVAGCVVDYSLALVND